MAPICPHCGSNQVSEWSNTETSNEGTSNRAVRYFCRNCKKDFTVTETRQYAPGMTWLVTFDSSSTLGDLETLEFYRGDLSTVSEEDGQSVQLDRYAELLRKISVER